MDERPLLVVQNINVGEGAKGVVLEGTSGRPLTILTSGLEVGLYDYQSRLEHFLAAHVPSTTDDVPFAGRRDVMSSLDEWLTSDSATFCLLTGPAGRGKSALAANWALHRTTQGDRVVFWPISARFRTNIASVVFPGLALRLSRLIAPRRELPGAMSVEAARGIVAELLASADGERIVLILDGLDEAADWEPTADLFPAHPPSSLKIIVTARPTSVSLSGADWLSILGWEGRARTIELLPLTREGVAAMIGPRAIGAVEPLFRLTEGDPLVARMYAEDVRAHNSPPRLHSDGVPGLNGYLDRWWMEQRQIWAHQHTGSQHESRCAAILGLLAFAKGPIERDDAIALYSQLSIGTLDFLTADAVFSSISRLVVGKTALTFSHPRLADHFRERFSPQERRRYSAAYTSWGLATIRDLSAGSDTIVSRYLVDHLGAHMSGDGVPTDTLALLSEQSWRQACLSADGDYTSYLADHARVWQRYRGATVTARMAREPEGLPLIFARLSWIEASIRATIHAQPSKLIAALVRNGSWSVARARRAISLSEDRETIIAGLIDVAGVVENGDERTKMISEALALASALLPTAAPADDGDDRASADDRIRAKTVELGLRAASHLPADQRASLLTSFADILLGMTTGDNFGSFSRLAMQMPPATCSALVDHGLELLNRLQFPSIQQAACFSPWLENSADILDAAVSAVLNIPMSHSMFKVHDAAGFIRFLSPQQRDTLTAHFRSLVDPGARCWGLLEVAGNAPPLERDDLLEEAREAACLSENATWLAAAALASSPKEGDDLVQRALASSKLIDDWPAQMRLRFACAANADFGTSDKVLDTVLAKVRRHPDKDDRVAVLTYALDVGQGTRSAEIARALEDDLDGLRIDVSLYEAVSRIRPYLSDETGSSLADTGLEIAKSFVLKDKEGSISAMSDWTKLVLCGGIEGSRYFSDAIYLAERLPDSYAKGLALVALSEGARSAGAVKQLVARCETAIAEVAQADPHGSGPGTLMGFRLFAGDHAAVSVRVALANALGQLGVAEGEARRQWQLCRSTPTAASSCEILASFIKDGPVSERAWSIECLIREIGNYEPSHRSGVFQKVAKSVAAFDVSLLARLQAEIDPTTQEARYEIALGLAAASEVVPTDLQDNLWEQCWAISRELSRSQSLDLVGTMLPGLRIRYGPGLALGLLRTLDDLLREWP